MKENLELSVESAKELRESLGLAIAKEWTELTRGGRQSRSEHAATIQEFLKKLDRICPVYTSILDFIKENTKDQHKHKPPKIDDMLPSLDYEVPVEKKEHPDLAEDVFSELEDEMKIQTVE